MNEYIIWCKENNRNIHMHDIIIQIKMEVLDKMTTFTKISTIKYLMLNSLCIKAFTQISVLIVLLLFIYLLQ